MGCLDLFEKLSMIDGCPGQSTNSSQNLEGVRIENAVFRIDGFDYADNLAPRFNRGAGDCAGFKTDLAIKCRIKARVFGSIRDNDSLAIFGYPTSNSLTKLQLQSDNAFV